MQAMPVFGSTIVFSDGRAFFVVLLMSLLLALFSACRAGLCVLLPHCTYPEGKDLTEI